MKITVTKTKTYTLPDNLSKALAREEAKDKFKRDEKRIKIKIKEE